MTVYQSRGIGARPKKDNTVQALLLKPARVENFAVQAAKSGYEENTVHRRGGSKCVK